MMKNFHIYFLILFISFNISCLNSKKATVHHCDIESLQYRNYDAVKDLNKIRDLPDIKAITDNSLDWLMSEGADFEEIKQDQIVYISNEEFFVNPNSKDKIPLYIIGYYQNNNIKQYVAAELHIGRNSSLYIINEVNQKIVSMFLANSNYNSGFSSENVETKRISDTSFQIKIYRTSDAADDKGSFYESCISQITMSEDGSLIPDLVTAGSE